MIETVQILLNDRVRWRVDGGERTSPPLPALRYWSIVSPIVSNLGGVEDSSRIDVRLRDGSYLCGANVVNLANTGVGPLEELIPLIPKYLNALRVVTGQSMLPRSIASIGTGKAVGEFEMTTLPLIRRKAPFSSIHHRFRGSLGSYLRSK
jgi:hypothetical protein